MQKAKGKNSAFLRLLPCTDHQSVVSFGSCLCLLAILLLTGCSSPNKITSHATPTAATGPAPVTTPLAAPPQNCALKPPPQVQHLDHLGLNTNVQLIGGGPFWLYFPFYQNVLHLSPSGSQQWPIAKIVVEVGPNYDQPVTLRLRQAGTGSLVWWTDGQTPPRATTQTLVLNPRTDGSDIGPVPGLPDIPHGSPDPGWKEWGTFPLFSVAGCYTLEVSWSGGSWQSSFAVGS